MNLIKINQLFDWNELKWNVFKFSNPEKFKLNFELYLENSNYVLNFRENSNWMSSKMPGKLKIFELCRDIFMRMSKKSEIMLSAFKFLESELIVQIIQNKYLWFQILWKFVNCYWIISRISSKYKIEFINSSIAKENVINILTFKYWIHMVNWSILPLILQFDFNSLNN